VGGSSGITSVTLPLGSGGAAAGLAGAAGAAAGAVAGWAAGFAAGAGAAAGALGGAAGAGAPGAQANNRLARAVNEMTVVAPCQAGRRGGEWRTWVVMLGIPLVPVLPHWLRSWPTTRLVCTYRGADHLPIELVESPTSDSGCHDRGRMRNAQ